MHRARLALAVAAAAAIILSAPFISRISEAIKAACPGHFVRILASAAGASVALAIVLAVIRIRSRRAVRYTCIAAAVAGAVMYSLWTSSPDPQVAAVERFHFLEYGLLTFLFYRAWRPLNDGGVLLLPVLAAMITGTVEEWFQWFIPGRVGTFDDVFLNWVAIACGLLFSVGIDPPDHGLQRLGRRAILHAGAAAVLFILVFGAFFDSVHVGHVITAQGTGSFTSLYTEEGLSAEARDREARWSSGAPIVRTSLSREDQYRTEGIQHVAERNEAWAAGDFSTAWRENAILERYYEPVLNTGHRWPAEQRLDAERRASAVAIEPGRYMSRAYPYEIYAWPSWSYWSVVGGLALAMLLLARRAGR